MNAHDDSEEERANDAMVRRLARLRDRPLDTAGLRRRVRDDIAALRPVRPARRWTGLLLRALAASLLLAGVLAVVIFMMCGSGLLLSPAELSLIHRQNVSGAERPAVADSMDSAERTLTRQWSQCPRLPDTPLAAVKCCHVHEDAGKRLACLEMTVDGQAVTLAVARAGDMRLPEAKRVSRNGVDYRMYSVAKTSGHRPNG